MYCAKNQHLIICNKILIKTTSHSPLPISSPISDPSTCSLHGKVIEDGESLTVVLAKIYPPRCIKCTCQLGSCEYDTDAECPGQEKKKSCKSHRGEVIQHDHSYTYRDMCSWGFGAAAHWKEPCCRKCVCHDGVTTCRRTEGRCEEDKKYKSCNHNGREIKHGQRYWADVCNKCGCSNGVFACTKTACWLQTLIPKKGEY